MSVGPETIQASTKDQRRLSEICDREWNLDKHVTELGRRNMYGDITSLRRERYKLMNHGWVNPNITGHNWRRIVDKKPGSRKGR